MNLVSREAAPADAVGAAALAARDASGADGLVETLRSARLTVLIGAADSGKSRLLKEAVRPMLHRRADDACLEPAPAAEPAGPGGIDLLERRRRRIRPRELVVWCDRWDGSPSERLHACLDEATGVGHTDAVRPRAPVALRVEALGAERGARLLFVFDHGDRLAPARMDGTGAAAEYDALLNVLCNIGPSVHVLVSAREEALPGLVRARLERHDTRVVRLPDRRRDAGQPLPAAAAMAPIAAPAAAVWTPPSESDEPRLQRDDVYRSIIDRLAAIDGGEREPAWGSAGAVSAAPGSAAAQPATLRDDPRRLGHERPDHAASRQGEMGVPRWMRFRAGMLGMAVLASAGVGVLLWQDRSPSAARLSPTALETAAARAGDTSGMVRRPAVESAPVGQAPAAEPLVPAPMTAAPSQVLAEPGSDAQVADELWRAIAVQGGTDTGADAVRALSDEQPLAIVSYDALRTLAAASSRAKTARVVAPLYTDELQVVVRADSPLTFLHELAGRRINVGAAQSRRGAAAAAVYRQLFEVPLPPDKTSAAGLGPALEELLTAQSLDAIVLIEPEPSSWLASLSDAQRRGLKLLRLARDAPSTRRALRAYLPATLHTPLGGPAHDVPTLGVMSFLVATAASPAGGGRPVATSAAQALCQALPVLRRDGHPAWRGVDPALRLPLPLPYDDGAAAVLASCEANRSTATAGVSTSRVSTSRVSTSRSSIPRPPVSVSQADSIDSSHPNGEHE